MQIVIEAVLQIGVQHSLQLGHSWVLLLSMMSLNVETSFMNISWMYYAIENETMLLYTSSNKITHLLTEWFLFWVRWGSPWYWTDIFDNFLFDLVSNGPTLQQSSSHSWWGLVVTVLMYHHDCQFNTFIRFIDIDSIHTPFKEIGLAIEITYQLIYCSYNY